MNANNPISQEAATKAFLAGEPVMMANYYGGKMELVKYRDKVTRQPAQFATIRHTVLNGAGALIVSERVEEENPKPDDYKQPFNRMDSVLLTITKMEVQNGIIICQGDIRRISK